jgi:hypothetical protein
MFELYEDIRPWQYYVDECGMKQESLDLLSRSIEFVLIHHRNDIAITPVYHYCSNPWCDGYLLYYLVTYPDGTALMEYRS